MDIMDRVDPGDIVLPRHHGLGPMTGTQLDSMLRNLNVTTIIGVFVSVNIGMTNFAFDAVNEGRPRRLGLTRIRRSPPLGARSRARSVAIARECRRSLAPVPLPEYRSSGSAAGRKTASRSVLGGVGRQHAAGSGLWRAWAGATRGGS
jgi:hypothetical protein